MEDMSMAKEYGLTWRQQLFVMHYHMSFNTTRAYKSAYKCSDRVANVNGHKLWKKPKIRAYYSRYKTVFQLENFSWTDEKFMEKLEWINWLDENYANNLYHWKKPMQPM